MKPLQTIATSLLFATTAQCAHAGVYKCGNKYQATPCNTGNPEAGQVAIKSQTEAEKAASAERLQQVRSEYETTKQQRAEKAEKDFEKSMKMAEVEAAQHNAREQARQADALEQEAAKPVPVILPPGFHQVIPPADRGSMEP